MYKQTNPQADTVTSNNQPSPRHCKLSIPASIHGVEMPSTERESIKLQTPQNLNFSPTQSCQGTQNHRH